MLFLYTGGAREDFEGLIEDKLRADAGLGSRT